MRSAFIALLMLAFALVGLGLFGITDFLNSMPTQDAVKNTGLHRESRPGALAKAYQDYVDSLDRSRNIAFSISVLSLIGGPGLGTWVIRTHITRRSLAGSGIGLVRFLLESREVGARQIASTFGMGVT